MLTSCPHFILDREISNPQIYIPGCGNIISNFVSVSQFVTEIDFQSLHRTYQWVCPVNPCKTFITSLTSDISHSSSLEWRSVWVAVCPQKWFLNDTPSLKSGLVLFAKFMTILYELINGIYLLGLITMALSEREVNWEVNLTIKQNVFLIPFQAFTLTTKKQRTKRRNGLICKKIFIILLW